MFQLNAIPPQVSPELIALLQQAEPATIGHFLHTGFMAPEIRLLTPGYTRIAGTAVTARCFGADGSIVHYALSQLRPGDILVLDRSGDVRHAACGGGVAYAAKLAGCIGIIIDGTATDIQELREFGLPVWARGLSPITVKRQFEQGDVCTPVSCGGVTVEAGDAIVADDNGVLVLKPQHVRAAAERAIEMQTQEKSVSFPRLEAGEKLGDMNGTNARIAEIVAAMKG